MKYKGAPILAGVGLILTNFLVDLFFPGSFFARTEFFLHLGLVIAFMGFLIGEVLG